MTERDPFGAALSAGEPGDRRSEPGDRHSEPGDRHSEPGDRHSEPGDRHSAAVNGETGHQLDYTQEPSGAQDVEGAEGLETPGEFPDLREAPYYGDLEEYYEPGDAGYAEEGEGAGESEVGDGEYGAPLWYGEDAEGYYALEHVEGDELGPEGAIFGDETGLEDAEPSPLVPADRPAARGPGQSRRKVHRRRWALAACVVAVAMVVVGVVGYIRVSHDINPTGPPGRSATVVIPAGASTHQIADLLAKAGVIHGADVFELYTKLEGAGALLPGTYHLPTNQAYSSALSALQNGPPPVTARLVVPEGFTIGEIATAVGRLPGIGISAQSFVQAATSGQVRSPYEPPGTNNLEGLLFPATYPVQKGETADYLVQYMVDTFDSYASQLGLSTAAHALHYTPYQVVTVASIVEREAKFESDRGPIASAIYNRLSQHMPIGAESTLLYGLGNPKGPVNMETRNPYNTLIHVGLPPTPISNPGIPSLEAAMKPPATSYIFWVEVNPDGKMGYASDQAGFVHLQAECRAAHLC